MRLIAKHIPRFQNRGMLGVNPIAANADGTGIKLEGVSENRPAALAGLQAGDIILQMDGLNTSIMPFFEIPFANSVGVTSVFKVQRGSDVLEFSVTRVVPH
jgi:S1-C subfamily serine protease